MVCKWYYLNTYFEMVKPFKNPFEIAVLNGFTSETYFSMVPTIKKSFVNGPKLTFKMLLNGF